MNKYLERLGGFEKGLGRVPKEPNKPPSEIENRGGLVPKEPKEPIKGGFLGLLGCLPPPSEKSGAALPMFERLGVLRWLASIEERDPEIVREVIRRCETDPEAKAYFLMRGSR